MAFASVIRPILSTQQKYIFSMRSLFLLHKISASSCSSIFACTVNHRYSNIKLCCSKSQFRKHSLLTSVVHSHEDLKLTNRFSTLPTDKDFDFEDDSETEKETKKGKTKMNSMRRDRQVGVELFQNILQEKVDSEWNSNDWMQVGEQLSSQLTGSWEVMCMHTLMADCNIHVGRSLMKFLEARPEPPGSVITTFYIGLLGKTCCGNPGQEMELKKYYDDLVSVTELFDAASIEVLVEGLSHTKFYRECVNLLEMCKLTSMPGLHILRNTLMGALRNGDLELCSFVLQQFEEPTQLIQCATNIIDIALESNNQEGLQMILDFMQKHSLSLLRRHLETAVESFQRSDPGQWKGSFGFVNYKSGKCSMCGHQLPRLHVSDEEFTAIQSAFLDQVIVSDNIFFKTSPEEVQNFIKFVDKFGPFDVVIDGLNALHGLSPKQKDKETLERLVSYFDERDRRVLVLGSKVLKSYVRDFDRFQSKPAVYMASTTRADDAFFLYAALRSGKNTLIVSSDKLRDHKSRLEPHLRHIFHRWLTINQIYNFVNPKTGKIFPKRHAFSLGPKKDEHGWHIPVNDTDMIFSFGRQGILCLRHGPENFIHTHDRPVRPFKPNWKQRTPRSFQDKEWFDL